MKPKKPVNIYINFTPKETGSAQNKTEQKKPKLARYAKRAKWVSFIISVITLSLCLCLPNKETIGYEFVRIIFLFSLPILIISLFVERIYEPDETYIYPWDK